MRHYTVVLIPDEQEGGYTVTVPTLPGLVTEGDSYDEAIANAKDAIVLYLEDLHASGEVVPVEGTPPTIVEVAV